MAKSKHEKAAELNADSLRLRQALKSLDLVDSALDEAAWNSRVAEQSGDEIVDEWYELMEEVSGNDVDAVYDFTYSSFERAKHFSVGRRSGPLAVECEWMLPRLREAISRSDSPSPFLVEIGTGSGAAAAILSAALEVPVIAIDSHPKTLGLPEQFAQATGGTVVSRVADIADLAKVLDGKRPAAAFGLTVYRYLQPHGACTDSFSDWSEMQRILAAHDVEARTNSFIEALGGADLLLAEMSCPDYLAEMAAGLLKFGYEIPKGGIKRIEGCTPDGPTVTFGIHFTTADLPKRNPNLLIEMFSPLPRPYADFESDPDNDPAAEALRLSLEPTELIEAAEIEYTDGSGRMRNELFGWGKYLIGQYIATTRGYRNLKFFPRNELEAVLEALHNNEAQLEQTGTATIYECNLPAPQWGSSLDT